MMVLAQIYLTNKLVSHSVTWAAVDAEQQRPIAQTREECRPQAIRLVTDADPVQVAELV